MSIRNLYTASPEPEFDVKIVGGKRVVIWKDETKRNAENLAKQSRSMSADYYISDIFRNRPLVLPPIAQTEHVVDSNTAADVNLWRQLHSVLKNYDEKRLNSILEDLKKRDLEKIRSTTPEILTAIAAHHELPVPPNLLQTLYERFATSFIPSCVQFDKLIKYVVKCKSQLPPIGKFVTANNHCSPLQLEIIMKNEARVIQELAKEIAFDRLRLDRFRKNAYELDVGRRGVLSKQQIEQLFKLANISINENLLGYILVYCNKQGFGLYDMTELFGFFERAKVQSQTSFQNSQRSIIITPTGNQNHTQLGPLPKMQFYVRPVRSIQQSSLVTFKHQDELSNMPTWF